jgi:hypothetical protein
VLDIVIPIAIIALLIIGFYLTRGAGPSAHSVRSPGAEELAEFTPLGDHVSQPDEEAVDRNQEIE